MQEGFVGITFREVSRSGQFVGNFFHRWGGVILSDDGLVQWHAVQTRSHFSRRLYWICGTVNPWSWFYLWLKDVVCNHAVQGCTDGFFALYWYLAPCLLYRPDAWVYLDGIFSLKTADSVKDFGYIAVSCSLSLIKAPTGSWNIGFSLHRGQLFH